MGDGRYKHQHLHWWSDLINIITLQTQFTDQTTESVSLLISIFHHGEEDADADW